MAAEYLRRRERELDRRIDPEARPVELQKAKAYIALHNAYGVDLNATAVELAEVSLWLNSMHPGMRAPWFGLHLRRGNSLIGASRKVYGADALPHGQWLSRRRRSRPPSFPSATAICRTARCTSSSSRSGLGCGGGRARGEEAGGGAGEGARPVAQRCPEDPKGPKPFEEKPDEPTDKRQARYARWVKAGAKTEAGRLQAVARRAEFLWSLVAKRLELSERKVSRRIDVWEAEWLEPSKEATDKQRVLDDLTAAGTRTGG
ncbi:hypothetical protein NKH18_38390 [Streptomyces sp. M10(2022)]